MSNGIAHVKKYAMENANSEGFLVILLTFLIAILYFIVGLFVWSYVIVGQSIKRAFFNRPMHPNMGLEK